MKKSNNGMFIGVAFILIGVLYACSALDIFHFSIFFPGWWTLFIILPCLYGLFRKNDEKTGYIIGLVIGLCFLVNAQDFNFHIDFWPLVLALICILIGVKLIFPGANKKSSFKNKGAHVEYDFDNNTRHVKFGNMEEDYDFNHGKRRVNINGKEYNVNFNADSDQYTKENGYLNISTFFGGKTVRIDNEIFTGAEINAVFAGNDLDLRQAVISGDVYIQVNAIFGGVDIYLPMGVRVVTDDCAAVFGSVDVHSRHANSLGADAPRVIISGACVFGGLEIY